MGGVGGCPGWLMVGRSGNAAHVVHGSEQGQQHRVAQWGPGPCLALMHPTILGLLLSSLLALLFWTVSTGLSNSIGQGKVHGQGVEPLASPLLSLTTFVASVPICKNGPKNGAFVQLTPRAVKDTGVKVFCRGQGVGSSVGP